MTGTISIRRVHPADRAALRDFYSALSPDSRRARFLGWVSGLSGEQSLTFCTPDHTHAEGFVAVSERPEDRGAILGHLCLEPAGKRQLELAVAVADAAQGSGVGRALFRAALDWAVARGFEAVIASCLADNWRVLSLLTSAPNPARIAAADAGVVNVYVPLQEPLPAEWRSAEVFAAPRRRHRSVNGATVPCRAVWRRTPSPTRGARG
jgi:GNAT superfamily N-acetyltransferase